MCVRDNDEMVIWELVCGLVWDDECEFMWDVNEYDEVRSMDVPTVVSAFSGGVKEWVMGKAKMSSSAVLLVMEIWELLCVKWLWGTDIVLIGTKASFEYENTVS